MMNGTTLTKEEKQIIEWYKKASLEILEILLGAAEISEFTIKEKKARLFAITKILSALDEKTQKWIDENIPKMYRRGVYETSEKLGEIKEKGYMIFPMGKIDETPIKILAEDIALNFGNAFLVVKKDATIKLNAILKTQIQDKIVSGVIRGESMASKEGIIRDLKKIGVTGFQGPKRRFSLIDYVDLLVRSQVAVAYNSGAKARTLASGRVYVKVTPITGRVDEGKCDPHEGKIYHLLNDADKLPPYHVRCAHSFSPVPIPDLPEEKQQEAKKFYSAELERRK